MNDQDSLDKNTSTLIGCYLWTPLCLLDNWDRVLLSVMNSKWLITWEGHSEWLVKARQVDWKEKCYLLLQVYVQSSFWVLAGSSSLLIIINICRWPSLCKLLNHPHPVGDETWHRFPRTSGPGVREPLLEMKIGNVKKCKYLQLVPLLSIALCIFGFSPGLGCHYDGAIGVKIS